MINGIKFLKYMQNENENLLIFRDINKSLIFFSLINNVK
jgi:hypothetical protein